MIEFMENATNYTIEMSMEWSYPLLYLVPSPPQPAPTSSADQRRVVWAVNDFCP